MNPPDLPPCARAILVERVTEEFPYHFVGAGFFSLYEDLGIFITAKHVISKAPADAVLVTPLGAENILELYKQITPIGDNSYEDLAFFPFRESTLNEVFPSWRDLALPLHPQVVSRARPSFEAGKALWVRGSPSQARALDPDARFIQINNVTLPAVYDVADSVRPFVHRGRFLDLFGLTALDGLSGAPIFTVDAKLGFAGCVIEASGISRIFHFIDSSVLLSAVRSIHRLHHEEAA